jgi:hypothetical protein
MLKNENFKEKLTDYNLLETLKRESAKPNFNKLSFFSDKIKLAKLL